MIPSMCELHRSFDPHVDLGGELMTGFQASCSESRCAAGYWSRNDTFTYNREQPNVTSGNLPQLSGATRQQTEVMAFNVISNGSRLRHPSRDRIRAFSEV